ncbi:unnamed protein product [Owenia fusiformis]|uniref:LRRNT domain-containing protein n=1 Tax=Owenia fusiformis TaxID=6347 RepID=A0A8S4Q401_OWEFU|nr:unnamed protein product [Owenia fusiformis]
MALLGVFLLLLLTQGISCDREDITCPDGTPNPGRGPGRCNCYQEGNFRVINCRNRGLMEIPRMNSTEEWDLLNFGINKITDVPTGIFEGLPNLKSVDFFFNTDLRTLQSNAFRGADEIQNFEFTRCNINIIGDNAFSNLYNLTTLNLQSNSLTEITEKAFGGLGALEYLRLDENKIQTIHPNAFQSLVNLTTLTFSGNKLTEVPERSFKPLTELGDLDLSNNNITTIPEEAFTGLVKLERLSLWKNQITRLPGDVFKNQDMLRILQLSENRLTELPQTLFHHTGNLTQLEIVKNALAIIENGTFERNVELKFLFLTDNNLSEWSLFAFTNLTSLFELALGQNEIENVPGFAFETLHRLKKLTLASQKPIKIHENAFCGLDSLQELDMSGSAMFGIRVCHLSHLPTYKNGLKLLVTGSKINCGCDMWSVQANMCPHGGNLTSCSVVGIDKNECVEPPEHKNKNWYHWSDWHYGEIDCAPEDKNPTCPVPCVESQPTTVAMTTDEVPTTPELDFKCPDGTPVGRGPRLCNCYEEDGKRVINCRNRGFIEIPRMNSTEEWDLLNFGINKITEVPTGIFEGLPNLKSIDFFYNTDLTTLQSNAFRGADEIQNFVFTRCSISNIGDNAFSNLYNLTTLNIQSNNLTVITERAFNGLGALEYLRLDENKIQTIHPNAFQSLVNLTTLTFSGNELTEVPKGSFKPLTELGDLDLSNNKITTIPEEAFTGLVKLERLSLWKNRITRLPYDVFKNQEMLRILQLSENRLTELPQTLFQHTGNLTQVELVKNNLTIIENGTFERNSELKFLFLTDNNLSEWSLFAFTNLTSLLELALGQNEIENVPGFAFETLHRLKKLTLASRKPIKIHENAFCGLDSLLELDMSGSAMFGFRVCHLSHLPTYKNGLRLLVTGSKINCGCDMWSVKRNMCQPESCSIVGIDQNECVEPKAHRGYHWFWWSDWHYEQIGCDNNDKNPTCPVPCVEFQPTTAALTTQELTTLEITTQKLTTRGATTKQILTTSVTDKTTTVTPTLQTSSKPLTEPPEGTTPISSSVLPSATTTMTMTASNEASVQITAIIAGASVGGVVVIAAIVAIVIAVVIVKRNTNRAQPPYDPRHSYPGFPPPYNGQNLNAPVTEHFYPPNHPMYHNGPQLPDGPQNTQEYTNPAYDNGSPVYDNNGVNNHTNIPPKEKGTKSDAKKKRKESKPKQKGNVGKDDKIKAKKEVKNKDMDQNGAVVPPKDNIEDQPTKKTEPAEQENHSTEKTQNVPKDNAKKERKKSKKNSKADVPVEPEPAEQETFDWP